MRNSEDTRTNILAAHNHLPMPPARVLNVNCEQCWATEILPGRDALRQKNEPWAPGVQEKLTLTLKNSATERRNFLRATRFFLM